MTLRTNQTGPGRAIGLDVSGVSKMFGSFVALKGVDLKVPAASFHAMLGENGAGKTTLVRCITGYYHLDHGKIAVDGHAVTIASPRDAHRFGIGMVHQSFTLVPSLTGAENLVIARADRPVVFHWDSELKRMNEFLERMPFRAPLDVPVWTLSAGEKQKLQILKQLYLNQRFLILDEPTSVLTPDEAEELLGRLRDMTRAGKLTICLITHKLREVRAFADEVTVLRRGEVVGVGRTANLTNADIAKLMVGDTPAPSRWTSRKPAQPAGHPAFEIRGLAADRDDGMAAFRDINLAIQPGEIVGIAGVSGNGQSALLEALCGQRAVVSGEIWAHGERVPPTRAAFAKHRMFSLPEEPLKNAAVGRMTVAENLALRTFDRPPLAKGGWLSPAAMRRQANDLIGRYRIKTPSPSAPIDTLSGGNIQRTVLARELSGNVGILIIANPCAGLDFTSTDAIHAEIMDQRNRGVAVLLVSEDLDEILELADRVVVMSGGRLTYAASIADTDRATIGHYMAGEKTAEAGI